MTCHKCSMAAAGTVPVAVWRGRTQFLDNAAMHWVAQVAMT
jgi:hypothetical protein